MNSKARVPPYVRAVFAALRFRDPEWKGLRELGPDKWRKALEFCDRSQLTLLLGRAAGDALPLDVQRRIEENLKANTIRVARVWETYAEAAAALDAAGIPFAVLKGFAHYPQFVADLKLRAQYDLDLAFAAPDVLRARDVLCGLGYEPLVSLEEFPTDHLPTMIRKTGWQWRGDYFDTEIPLSVDLHFRFWDQPTERLPAPGVECFFERRVECAIGGRRIPCLHPVDAVAYASLHLLRHLLRGSVKPMHAYELAYFLHLHSDDVDFWREWQSIHPEPLRRLEAIGFKFAAEWFHCSLSPAVSSESDQLPEGARSWFDLHAMSPVEAQFHPNKSEIWLHLALLETRGDKWRVLRRRLLPARLPGAVDAVHVPDSMLTVQVRVRSALRYAAFLAVRARHHIWSLFSLANEGGSWWWRANRFEPGYWPFLAAASLYNLGMFVFVVLYNLYLLAHGYGERDLGSISSAMTAGSIAGTLAAGLLARRTGLRAAMMLAFGVTAAAGALRTTVSGLGPLMGLAFVHGAAFAGWAVSIPPAIAALTTERRRAAGFSVFFSSSIALGIAGGWIAGHLPGWLAAAPLDPMQAALLSGCALAALAVWPASQLRIDEAVPAARTEYPRSGFIARYLAVFAVWNLAIGAFNPFFNAYFSTRHHVGAEQIGNIFSISQLGQVLALCFASYMLRRWGLASGVARMMIATSIALVCLAGAHSAAAAAAAYTAYMAFQSMSEPGISTLLMNGVRPEERRGAASLSYLAACTAQAIAAAAAGWLLSQNGYPAVLLGTAALAVCAALAFGRLRPGVTDAEPRRTARSAAPSLPESAPGSAIQ